MFFFSPKEIEGLVVRAAAQQLHLDSVRQLIYVLSLPGPAAASAIAETLAERPPLLARESLLPSRLAFGIVDFCLLRHDIDADRIRLLCNRVERIRIELMKLERSARVIDHFSLRLNELILFTAAARDLASDREFLNAELASLVERIIVATMIQKELVMNLTGRIALSLRAAEKTRFLDYTDHTIENGLKNPPWDDTEDKTTLLRDLTQPIQFRRTLYDDPYFVRTARNVPEHLAQACHLM